MKVVMKLNLINFDYIYVAQLPNSWPKCFVQTPNTHMVIVGRKNSLLAQKRTLAQGGAAISCY